jgi:hypothetical protein
MSHSSTLAIVAFIAGQLGGAAPAGGPVTSTAPTGNEGAVLPIRVTGSGGTTEGTCFLIHQETREHDVVLYFVTAGHLFSADALGDGRIASLRIRLIIDQTHAIETGGDNVVFPAGAEQGLDLAVVKAACLVATLAPLPMSTHPPRPGDMFTVRRYQADELMFLTERVRFRSSRLVLGDRTAAHMIGLAGAPAVTETGVFGVVSECSSDHAPVIVLLSAASGFLSRAIPGWTGTPIP